MARGDAVGFGGLFRRIDVEEGIDRCDRPFGDAAAVARAPLIDLAHALFVTPRRKSARNATGQSATTGCRRSPEAAQAICSPAATRASCRRATRSRGRNGQSPGTLTSHAISGASLAAQSRPASTPASGRLIRHAIGNLGEAAIGKACRITGGIEDEPAALRSDTREDAFENGRAADADARLVAAAHPPRLPASEDDPDRRRICRAR